MKHPPLPMAPSSPGTKVPRVPGGKHEEHCGLHSGHNVDWELLDPTQKAAQGKRRVVARAGGEANRGEDEIPFWIYCVYDACEIQA